MNTPLFSFPTGPGLTPDALTALRAMPTCTKASPDGGEPSFAAATHEEPEFRDQFVIFQLNPDKNAPALLESGEVEPKFDGSAEAPDVLVALQMVAFQVAANEGVANGTKATVRLSFGKDENSSDRRFDAVFWSIAAGVSLFDPDSTTRDKRADGKDLKADFRKAFGNRPIEIPGGLGKMSFEVIKHQEPTWWQRTFGFLQSDTGKRLVSVLGFPAVTQQAIGVLDELLNNLVKPEPKALFKSLPLQLALSKYARDQVAGENARVRVGCLRPGYAILARARDFDKLNRADIYFHSPYGKLVPGKITPAALMEGYDDPVKDVTYAVLQVGMQPTKIDPTFNFSA